MPGAAFERAERMLGEFLAPLLEALAQFTPEEKAVARIVLESLILKHDAARFSRPAPASAAQGG